MENAVAIPDELVQRIRDAFKKGNYTLQVHGIERMIERSIHPQNIRLVVLEGKPIEYASAGTRGVDASVLFDGKTKDNHPIHVKVAERVTIKGYRHFVVTVYEPDPKLWQNEFSKRW
jgi:Domain of unknown function (DUF4258)